MKKKAVKITPKDPVYAIGIVSKLLHMPEWTLRSLEKEGLVKPKRLNKKIRVYSMEDIKKIEEIQYIMEEKRVSIHGVRVIYEMKQTFIR